MGCFIKELRFASLKYKSQCSSKKEMPTTSNHKMQMMETFISARLLQLPAYHKHGKQPSHSSRIHVGGSTGERRGWLTHLLHSTTEAAGCLTVSRVSLTQEWIQDPVSGVGYLLLSSTKRSHEETFGKQDPIPFQPITWTCCLRKSCVLKSGWSKSCKRTIWNEIVRSLNQSRWTTEKRTCNKSISFSAS